MSVSFAHVGAFPLEEGLLTFAPVACVVAALIAARLRELGAWLRRR